MSVSNVSMFQGRSWKDCAYSTIPISFVWLRTYWHGQRLIDEASKRGEVMNTGEALVQAEEVVKQENVEKNMLPVRTPWRHY